VSNLPHVPIWPGDKNVRGPGPYRIDSFAACPQREAFGYEMKLTPLVARDQMEIGTLVHAALAYHYGRMLAQRPAWFVYADPYDAVEKLGAVSGRFDLVELAKAIYAWYAHQYQNDPWIPVLVEHQFQAHLGDDKYITARTDLIAMEYGDLILADHKIKGTLPRNTGSALSMDRQMLTNLALARAAGYDIKRVYINGVTRGGKPTPFSPPLFGRFAVPVSAEAYATFGRDTDYYMTQRAMVKQRYPDPAMRPRNTNACMTSYGPCDFKPLCEDGMQRIVEFRKKEY
jgi:hypothetical protein